MTLPEINLGQYPRQTTEDVRLQTSFSLDKKPPLYFYTQPSFPGTTLRALHSLLTCFCRHLKREQQDIRCLAWGFAGDLVHVKKYLSGFDDDLDFYGVVSDDEHYNWAASQLKENVWLEREDELYAQPPVPVGYFNCVLALNSDKPACRSKVLRYAKDYVNRGDLSAIISVDDDNLLCDQFSGSYYQGGPVWKTHG
jgi:hypothetical protein